MTGFRIERYPFRESTVRWLREQGGRYRDWPVVYVLDDGARVYVGETVNAASRMHQHRMSAPKAGLTAMRLVLDDTFNKSACLDLESQLIRYFSGDARLTVLNRNVGIHDSDYYNRHVYRETFNDIFEALRADGMFTRSIREIENSDLFKLSPFKALTQDQAIAVEDILEGLFADLDAGAGGLSAIEGAPGTGKTIVAIYLIKLLRDIAAVSDDDLYEADSMFAEFFASGYREKAAELRIGLVIPQQSLRQSVRRVFKKTPGLSADMVLSQFDVGKSADRWDLLIVDEAHRLNHRANQASGPLNKAFTDINVRLFGHDADHFTQLDWIRTQSRYQLLLMDRGQSVRPADLPQSTQRALIAEAKENHRWYPLTTQMRVKAGVDYVEFIRSALSGEGTGRPDLGEYDLRLFDDAQEMRDAIAARDAEVGLSRLVAGYAWEWRSKNDKTQDDLVIGDFRAKWNSTAVDWINSPTSVNEVGSIHTVQGYDLNYAGVIIGPDLRWDAATRRVVADRQNYFDKKGMENNPRLGITYTDEDLRRFLINIYVVLMTRGMLGTYVYVCDPGLREALRESLQKSHES